MRLRKVKCNLIEKGDPCLNCQGDGAECTMALSKRSRRYRLQKKQLVQTCASSALSLLPQTESQLYAPSACATAADSNEAAQDARTMRNHQQCPPEPHFDAQVAFVPTDSSTLHRLRPIPVNLDAAPGTSQCIELPPYIRPAHRDIDPEELHYLRGRGALSIPDPVLRDQLLLAFVLYVYPFLPIVNLQEVISAIEETPGYNVSLILFQAIMFAGTAFVDLQLILDAGFENRLAARAYFFRRIKVS